MRDAYEPTADDVRSDAPDGPEELFGFNPYGSGPVPVRPRTPSDADAPDTDKRWAALSRLFKIPTPIPADPRFVELCQEIFAIACERRAIVEAAGSRIDLYFEQLSDATACVDLVEALTMDCSAAPPSPRKSFDAGARAHL